MKSVIVKHCALCQDTAIMTDTAGYKWCVRHKDRGVLLNYGSAHDYPNLQCHPYAIGPGRYCWIAVATIGTATLVNAALVAMERVA